MKSVKGKTNFSFSIVEDQNINLLVLLDNIEVLDLLEQCGTATV